MSRRFLRVSLLSLTVVGAFTPAIARAQTRTDFINGAACTPYLNEPAYGFSFAHWQYEYGVLAFCQLTMSTEWPLAALTNVMFEARTGPGGVSGRLCVRGGTLSDTCGSPGIVNGNTIGAGFAFPPVAPPPFQTGAYLQLTMPAGNVTTIMELRPQWSK